MRVLVTGGAGFIGSHIVSELRDQGHEAVVLDCWHPAAHARPGPPAPDLIVGDVRDADVVEHALSGVDAVCHQAAMVGMGVDLDDAPEYASCNDLGTAVLLAAMARRGVKRLVLASSMVVYGEGGYRCIEHGVVRPAERSVADLEQGQFEPRCPTCAEVLAIELVGEDAPLEPRSVYAATKLAQEHLAGAWARAVGGSAVSLRYHNVYGPLMPRDTPYAGVAAIFRSSLERGEAPAVFEDGGQVRDFVHVRDVARANVLALSAGRGGVSGYNVASGKPTTVLEMATALSSALAGPAPVVTGRFRAGDVRHVLASPAKARRELGFEPAVGFEDGMIEFAKAPLRGA